MSSASSPSVAPSRQQWALGLDILAMALLTVAVTVAFPIRHPETLSLAGRVMVPGKMLILVLLASGLIWRRGERWRDIGLGRPRRLWALPIIVVIGWISAYVLVGLMVGLLFPILHLPRPGVGPFGIVRGHLGEYLYWLLPVTWGSAAFGEEMLFRGFFFTRLLKLLPAARWAAPLAVLMQAAVFGSLHLYLGPSGVLVAGLLGVVLATVYLVSGRNLWASIIIHGLIDSTSMTLIFLGVAKT